jgi:heptosyltransferase-2
VAQKPNLLIQTAFFGDLLLTIPLLRAMRILYPSHPLHLLCRSPFATFFKEAGIVDEAIPVNKRNKESWKAAKAKMKFSEYNLVLSPHKSMTSAILARSLKAERRRGYHLWWNFWAFQDRVVRPMHYPEVIRQLWMLGDLDADLRSKLVSYGENFSVEKSVVLSDPVDADDFRYVPSWASMSLGSESSEASSIGSSRFRAGEIEIDRLLQGQEVDWQKKNLILLAPGSVWPTKRWGDFPKLAQRLVELGFKIVLVGAKEEFDLCADVAQAHQSIVNLAGVTDVIASYWLMRKAQLLISNDSGAMHLASVAELPTIAIFGPTTLDIGYRPWQNQALVIQKDLPCRPCGLHGSKSCPLGTHLCMKTVTVETVVNKISIFVKIPFQ